MAQDSRDILKQILGVCVQINKKIGGKEVTGDGTAGAGDKSDKGTGPLSGMFGKGGSTKKAKEASNIIKSIFESITNFNKVKINARQINMASKAIRGLFDTVVYIGRSKKTVLNAIRLFQVLAKSLAVMTKFAKAMTTLLMAVGVSILALAGGIALAGVLLGTPGKPLATMMIIIGVLVGLTGAMILLGKAKSAIKPGAKVADKMGDAMKSLGIGLVVFVGSLLLISHMLKLSPGPAGMAKGVLMIVGVIAGMALVFAGLGLVKGYIMAGTAVAGAMALGMVALALGVFAFVTVAAMMTGMYGKGEAVNRKGEKKGQFGQMMANIGPGLGVMGIVLVSSGLLFAGLGAISWLIIPGVIAGLFMAAGMVLFAMATKKVLKIAREVGKPEEATKTISGMVSGVIKGLIHGLSIGLMGKEVNSAKELSFKGFMKLNKGLRMLRRISRTVSLFAKALTAFAEVDNMRVITGFDEKTGEPKFGPTVDIRGVGDTIRDTLVSFLVGDDGNSGLLGATEGLRSRQGAAIGRMARALTGKRGLLTAIIQFADVLKTFAQFGPEGKIGYIDMVPDGTDEDGNAKFKQVPKTVLITEVTTNITESFSQFASGLSAGVEGVGIKQKDNMMRLAEVLIGKKRGKIGGWFSGDKPGLLEPINAFADTLMLYAKFGEDSSIPILDEDGNPTGGSISIDKIVTNIVKAISEFSTQLSSQLAEPGETVGQAQKKMEGYMGLIEQLSVLSVASEGLDKTAVSIMSLATSMSALADSVNKFELDKLEVFADIAKDKSSLGGLVAKSQENASARRTERFAKREERQEEKAEEETQKKEKSAAATASKEQTVIGGQPVDINMLADAIGSTVSAAFKNGQFTFEFATDKSGVLNFS